jgi:protein-L-isoaspartate(D-aspartate) O-methyltransferase
VNPSLSTIKGDIILMILQRSLFISFLIFFSAQAAHALDQSDYAAQRAALVRTLKQQGIRDKKVLEVMNKVPREKFIPFTHRLFAYGNFPLAIGHGQTISQPYIVAYMTEALELRPNDSVLEIGTGSGYQAAVLAEIVYKVYSIEIVEPLGKKADKLLKALGYKNISVRIGDGYQGWPKEAPFDAIIVTAAPPEIPQKLVEQLKEGGRMIVPVGEDFQQLELLLKKKGGEIEKKKLLPVRFVPMTGNPKGK